MGDKLAIMGLKNIEIVFYSENMDLYRDSLFTFNFGASRNLYTYCRDNQITAFVMAENLERAEDELLRVDELIDQYGIRMTDEQLDYMCAVLFGLSQDEADWLKVNSLDDTVH